MENSKFIKIYEEAFTNFFKKESIIQKTNPDIYEFAVRYSEFRYELVDACTEYDQMESSIVKIVGEESLNNAIVSDEVNSLLTNNFRRFEIPELVFFGLSNKVKATHQYLTDRRAFWAIFSYLYTYIEYPSFMKNEIIFSCLEQDRLNIDLPERNRCMAIFQITSELFSVNLNEYMNNNSLLMNRPLFSAVASDMLSNKKMHLFQGKCISSRKFCNQSARNISNKNNANLKSIVDPNGHLIVYRGFDVDRSENIRQNRFKTNNPNSHIQQSGVGMSYSPQKEGATVYSMSKFKDTLTLSNNERVFNKSSIKFDLLDINKERFLDVTNKIPVVGKYSAEKKDILFSNVNVYGTDSDLHSSEIVFLPESVKLIDYRIMNISAPVKIFDKVA